MPDRTTKQRNEVKFVLVDVCGWIACNDPTSCRCSNDVRANVDGVYRIREEVTDEDCGLNSSWSIVLLLTLSLSLLQPKYRSLICSNSHRLYKCIDCFQSTKVVAAKNPLCITVNHATNFLEIFHVNF